MRDMASKAIQAFEKQFDLVRWWATPQGVRWGEAMHLGMSMMVDEDGGDSFLAVTPHLSGEPEDFAKAEKDTLLHANTYWIQRDMVHLAAEASKSMLPQALLDTDLPSPIGFCVFETPVITRNWHTKLRAEMTAMAWRKSVRSIKITDEELQDEGSRFYVDENGNAFYEFTKTEDEEIVDDYEGDEEDHLFTIPLRERPYWSDTEQCWLSSMDYMTISFYGSTHDTSDALLSMFETQPEGREVAESYRGAPWLLSSVAPWLFKVDYHNLKWSRAAYKDDEVILPIFIQSLFALMQQTIVISTAVEPSRNERRRLDRSGLLTDRVDDIRVVTLRRRLEKPHEYDHSDGGRDYSHRWIVKGHWRKQWYPTLGHHRQIWIDAYEKGPEDKPLVVKNTVFALRR